MDRLSRLATNQTVLDIALALFMCAIALTLQFGPSITDDASFRDPNAGSGFLIAFATLPLAIRRRYPLIVLGVVSAAVLIFFAVGFGGTVEAVAVLVALFTVGARCRRRVSTIAMLVTVALFMFGVWLERAPDQPAEYLVNAALGLIAVLLGQALRENRLRAAAFEERAERAERERELTAQKEVVAERLRIARDLHDIVAHSLSVIVVQAGAAQRVMDATDTPARDALSAIEGTGRRALTDVRQVLGGLRGTDNDRSPQPGTGELDTLIEQSRLAGTTIEFEILGKPRHLSAGVDLALFRIVQEALTNVRKHAGPQAMATVRLSFWSDRVEVVVEDDGRGAAAENPGEIEAGHGILGMRERAATLGGHLDSGPRPGGGYATRAVIPLVEEAS